MAAPLFPWGPFMIGWGCHTSDLRNFLKSSSEPWVYLPIFPQVCVPLSRTSPIQIINSPTSDSTYQSWMCEHYSLYTDKVFSSWENLPFSFSSAEVYTFCFYYVICSYPRCRTSSSTFMGVYHVRVPCCSITQSDETPLSHALTMAWASHLAESASPSHLEVWKNKAQQNL